MSTDRNECRLIDQLINSCFSLLLSFFSSLHMFMICKSERSTLYPSSFFFCSNENNFLIIIVIIILFFSISIVNKDRIDTLKVLQVVRLIIIVWKIGSCSYKCSMDDDHHHHQIDTQTHDAFVSSFFSLWFLLQRHWLSRSIQSKT